MSRTRSDDVVHKAFVWPGLLAVLAAAALAVPPSTSSAQPPNGRGYELVSPADKNGGDVLLENSRSRASVAGNAFQFASLVGFGDVRGTAISTEYIARRTTGGWITHGITPRQDPLSGFLVFAGPGDAVFEGEFSSDLSAGVVRANAFPQGATNVSTVQNLFARRDLLSPGFGNFQLATDSVVPIPAPWTGFTFPPPPEIVPPEYKPFFADASADFSHVIFESILNLTQDVIDADMPRSRNDHKLYEWVNGTVRYVGVLPDDEGGGLVRAVAGRGASGFVPFYTNDTISDDGSRIIFTAPETGQLYMRIEGADTVRVNASERRSPDPTPQPAEFRTATPDASQVFFTTEEQLTDVPSNGRNLWRYDVEAPAGARLTLLSTDEVPGDGHSPVVTGVLGVSADGQWVYFIGNGALVADMPSVDPNAPVIYQWHAGRLKYVGQLRQGLLLEERATGEAFWPSTTKTSRVTADGRHALFVTVEGNQLPPHDHGNCGTFPCQEIYVFDADASGGDGRLVCASCDPSGAAATGDNRFITHVATGGAIRSSHLVRPLSEDGRFAFFHTTQRLSPDDRNDRFDVYEYDLVNDRLGLISSGRADALDAYFMDASASGHDVFFATRERLVGWDVDGSYDIYDARIGGGFPEPARRSPLCAGDACQGGAAIGPAPRTWASRSFQGAGNVQARGERHGRRCRHAKVRKRVRGRVRCVRKRRHAARRAVTDR